MTYEGGVETVRILLRDRYVIPPDQITRLQPLASSVMNPNWVVDLDPFFARRLDFPASLVVRCFLRNRAPARLQFQMRVHSVLLRAGFPVPEVVVNDQGDVLTSHEGESWAVYHWVDGQEHDYASLAQAQGAADMLARMHLCLAREDIPGYVEPEGFPPYPLWANDGHQLILECLETVESGLPAEDRELALTAQRWLATTLPGAHYENLPKQLVWGDFHGRNMKFAGSEVVGLFDFDVVRWESPMYDLGTGILMFGRKARGQPEIRLDRAAEIIRAYTRRRPVTSLEADSVLPLLLYRHISDFGSIGPLPLGGDVHGEVRKALRVIRAVRPVIPELKAVLARYSEG